VHNYLIEAHDKITQELKERINLIKSPISEKLDKLYSDLDANSQVQYEEIENFLINIMSSLTEKLNQLFGSIVNMQEKENQLLIQNERFSVVQDENLKTTTLTINEAKESSLKTLENSSENILNVINEHEKSLKESIENLHSNTLITNNFRQEIKDQLPDKVTTDRDMNQIIAIVSQLSKSVNNLHNNSKIWESNMKTMIDTLNKLPRVLDNQTDQLKLLQQILLSNESMATLQLPNQSSQIEKITLIL
jgi:hypothetical protein